MKMLGDNIKPNKFLMAAFAVFVALLVAGTVSAAVNTTGINEMADTIVVLLIALLPVLLILGIWGKMKGVFSVVPVGLAAAVNTTGITEMADTIVVLLIALIPILLILGIWGKMKGVF